MSEHSKRAARHAYICYHQYRKGEGCTLETGMTLLIADLLVALHDDGPAIVSLQGIVAQALEMALAETQPQEEDN